MARRRRRAGTTPPLFLFLFGAFVLLVMIGAHGLATLALIVACLSLRPVRSVLRWCLAVVAFALVRVVVVYTYNRHGTGRGVTGHPAGSLLDPSSPVRRWLELDGTATCRRSEVFRL